MRSPRTILVLALSCGLTAQAQIAKADDAFPVLAVVFFNAPSCPAGWESYQKASNRLLVPMSGSEVGQQVPPGPTAGHTQHFQKFNATLILPSVSYALGSIGCLNNCVVAAGAYPFTGEGTAADDNLPKVELLPCEKGIDEPVVGTIPSGLMSYFFRDVCPKHWTQVVDASGRILIGLPAGGTASARFGGPPLSSGEDRKHSHRVSGTMTTLVQEVAAASGGAGGYGANGTYPYNGITEESSTFEPYLALLLCRKD
jgi:hypothetical protein